MIKRLKEGQKVGIMLGSGQVSIGAGRFDDKGTMFISFANLDGGYKVGDDLIGTEKEKELDPQIYIVGKSIESFRVLNTALETVIKGLEKETTDGH